MSDTKKFMKFERQYVTTMTLSHSWDESTVLVLTTQGACKNLWVGQFGSGTGRLRLMNKPYNTKILKVGLI